MTTAEALAVVRTRMNYAESCGFGGFDQAFDALALIEERLREWERMEERRHSVESKALIERAFDQMHDDALARAEKAEAERDERPTRLEFDHAKVRAQDAERRVAELEAALRPFAIELTERQEAAGSISWQVPTEWVSRARRALGEAE